MKNAISSDSNNSFACVLWVLFWKNVSAKAAGNPDGSNRKRQNRDCQSD